MMGTNYYIKTTPCEHCGHEEQVYHIGKSSHGWCFGVHVEPDEGINTLDDVIRLWEQPGSKIVDEYGGSFSDCHMLTLIKDREGTPWDGAGWHGYANEAAFHTHNNSERGPNNLLRCRISLNHCIGHGEGPWDYIQGEFS